MSKRRKWTGQELETLRKEFPHVKTQALADKLGRSVGAVSGQAYALGIKKTPEYLATEESGRLIAGTTAGQATWFKKGQKAWNKGKPHPARGRSAETQFKKGQRSHTHLPVGSERITKDGLIQVKMHDTGYPPHDWVSKHRVVWEQHNGPLPKGRIVVFKNGNNRDFDLSNLEAITRSENMKRNTRHRYGPEINSALYAKGALTRKINQLTKRMNDEKQN